MSNQKITELSSLSQNNLDPANDLLLAVDVSNTSMSSGGTNVKISPKELTGKSVSDLVQTWNDSGTIFSGLKLNVTDTASDANSSLLDLQVGSSSKFKIGKDGTIYVNGSVFSGGSWGNITGTLSSQTDLQNALNAKLGGSTGSIDNRVLRSDGTGGLTVQASPVTIDDSGNISGLTMVSSTLAGSMSSVNPQTKIVVYGGFSGYGVGFDNNGELSTVVNSALKSTLGTHLKLSSNGEVQFNSATNLSGSYDTKLLRNATGPSAEIRAAGGLIVNNADATNFAQIQALNVRCANGIVQTRYINNSNTTWSAWEFPQNEFAATFSPGVAGLLRFEGKTSSFPALKRSSTTLQVRLADDSADAALACGAITASGVVLIPDGAVGSPAIAFASDTDTGIYRTTNNTINFACGGQLRQQFQSDGSVSLGGTDPWIYTGYYAIRQGGSGVINLRASNGTTPATVSLGTLNASALVNVGTYTFGTLPAAASNAGALAQITDSSVTTNGTIAAGGGSSRALVFSNGTDWIVVVA